MSNRANEYRQMIEDVIAGGLLEDEEIAELRDMLARVQRKMLADLPADQATEAVAG